MENSLKFLKEFELWKKQLSSDLKMKRVNFPLRLELQEKCEDFIRRDPVSAFKNKILQSYWKLSFYEIIDYYRRGIQHFIRSNQKGDLDEIAESYRNFLNESAKKLKSLTKSLRKQSLVSRSNRLFLVDKLGSDPTLIARERPRSKWRLMRYSLSCCYLLFVFWGDIERYKALLSSTTFTRAPDWSKAVHCYECAIALDPDNGNAYNQLAVVASYDQNALSTLYHYARSLSASKSPFATAKTNLATLLAKNSRLLHSLYIKSGRGEWPCFIASLKTVRLVLSSVSHIFHLVSTAQSRALFESQVDSFAAIAEAVLLQCRATFFSNSKKAFIQNALFEMLIVSLYLFAESCQRPPKPSSRQACAFLWTTGFLAEALSVAKEGFVDDTLFLVAVAVDFCRCHSGFRRLFVQVDVSAASDLFGRKTRRTLLRCWGRLLCYLNATKAALNSFEQKRGNGGLAPFEDFAIESVVLPEERELRGFWPLADKYCSHAALMRFAARRTPGCDLQAARFVLPKGLENGVAETELEKDVHFAKRAAKLIRFAEQVEWIRRDGENGRYEFSEAVEKLFYQNDLIADLKENKRDGIANSTTKSQSNGNNVKWRSSTTRSAPLSKKSFQSFALAKIVDERLTASLSKLDLESTDAADSFSKYKKGVICIPAPPEIGGLESSFKLPAFSPLQRPPKHLKKERIAEKKPPFKTNKKQSPNEQLMAEMAAIFGKSSRLSFRRSEFLAITEREKLSSTTSDTSEFFDEHSGASAQTPFTLKEETGAPSEAFALKERRPGAILIKYVAREGSERRGDKADSRRRKRNLDLDVDEGVFPKRG